VVRSVAYVPERGDAVWLNFNPQAGREQAGHRPGLVLSPSAYNQRTGLALICLITSRGKDYPFECSLPAGLKIQGFVLSDHLRCLDWRDRKAVFITKVPKEVVEEAAAKVTALIGG
jgi:mRNA interferase MazF